MKLFYHPDQEHHAPPTFLLRGRPVDSPEGPVRAELLSAGLASIGLSLTAPTLTDSELLRKRLACIHTQRYLEFLETIHARWRALPNAADIVAPNVHPCGGGHHYPRHPVGQVGWHMHDMACPMTATSFTGILASAASAEAAADVVLNGESSAYALCRPPGHHAGQERAGGFCFLNNSGLAASVLRERFSKVAILDVDLHHGNGTQDIFYDRGDVWTGSLHADTADFYPFFWGGADEHGEGEGSGANVNFPLPLGSGGALFIETLERLIERLESFKPDALVVALGLDAHKDDPLAGLTLETEDFTAIGRRLAAIDLPTVLVQEGGYPTEHLGDNLAAFMSGYSAA
ncbi:histone deacetylase family protein [Halomonas urumqiensis]|uniref:Acetylpolyamine amidohydrolase n=1 Tax=Halomonas urumqiensis TaxID=1684789 RepID=A0A2N7UQK5_9GAMM|nr:histone deacetylase family protein [Halomonas urumqiensis]PMR82716.1 acetylpolyamine amidohydrolase [Halomonas urumqiensis]PTB01965.1 histone deacetylase family protein [Halomonas urumqiensis]GHE22078.1 acetylpolyamine amidohydrolase [Halomonas urumqiensis]